MISVIDKNLIIVWNKFVILSEFYFYRIGIKKAFICKMVWKIIY